MPVDLSKMGLEGLESFSQRQLQQSQTEHLSALARAQNQETDHAARMQDLEMQASNLLRSTAMRENGPNLLEDPEEAARGMQSLSDPLETVGRFMIENGAVEAGADYLSKASEIAKRESDIQSGRITDQKNRLENIIKTGDLAGRVLGGARNASEWKRGLAVMRESGGLESEFMDQLDQMPFSPDVAAYFAETATSAVQRAQLEFQALNLDARERDMAMRGSNSRRNQELAAARLAETKRHNAVVEKNAGNKGATPGAPSARNQDNVKALLQGTLFKGSSDKAGLEAASEYVASQAESIVRENKAISWDAAVQQAIGRAKVDGVLKTFTITESTGIPGTPLQWDKKTSKKTEVDLEGKSATNPVMPPINDTGGVDPSQLKRGTYYKLPSGEVGRYDGKGFVIE